MRIPFLQGTRDYALEPLRTEDAAALAELHREDFSRPWSEDEFAGLLAQETVFGYAARERGRGAAPPVGFVLAREVAGEGEILTVAVARAHRRGGIGWLLVNAVLGDLHARRAEALFLEVDETNVPALSLYRRLGFHKVGHRPNYYDDPVRGRTGALVMRRDLR